MLIKVQRRFSENGGRRGTVRPMGANRPCDGPGSWNCRSTALCWYKQRQLSGFYTPWKMAVRSTWQILTGGWVGWRGKLEIDMLTPVVCDLILQFVIASCVARNKTKEGHNWNRIANAENKKKVVRYKRRCTYRHVHQFLWWQSAPLFICLINLSFYHKFDATEKIKMRIVW